jgi:hypothetical protein
MDRLVPDLKHGPLLGVLTTTYGMQPEFFETDFLPTFLGLGAWDDRNWTSRIAMEKHLAQMEAAAVLLDARQYCGRPRSLRVEIVPTTRKSGHPQPAKLHAKVTLIVHEKAVRLLVGSANLTEFGYRRNREVMAALVATAEKPAHAQLIQSALQGLQEILGEWLSEGSRQLVELASERLSAWNADSEPGTAWFAWGGGPTPLWRLFLDRWPTNERVEQITIVSPFWSEEVEKGPLASLLSELKDRQALGASARVRLLAKAVADTQSSCRPELPASFGSFDPSPWGVSVEAWAVDPRVASEEIGLGEDICVTRELHAKVVLLEGSETSLAYLGSANFSRHGWGFLSNPWMANIEAGLILPRVESWREQLRQLVPPTTGRAVLLRGDAGRQLAVPTVTQDQPSWPSFLKELLLSPAGPSSSDLDLVATTVPTLTCGPWRLTLTAMTDEEPEQVLLAVEPNAPRQETYRVSLTEPILNRLLREQEVLVQWWEQEEGRAYPLNVDLTAREELPIAPGSGQPGEQNLIAYYQGRITWEDLFPPPSLPPGSGGTDGGNDEENNVDTSQIQSYQVREFVEALAGIMGDLKGAAQSSRPCMRLALLGSVSPVALARRVCDAVQSGRTAAAAGFQLVEIIACLQSARPFPADDRHRKDWSELLDEAIEQVDRLLEELRKSHPETFSSRMFRRYEATTRKHSLKNKVSS